MKKKSGFFVVQTMHDFHIICPNSLLFDYGQNCICEKCLGKRIKIFPFFNSCDRRGLLFSVLKGIRSFIAINLIGHEKLVDKIIAPSNLMKDKLIREGIKENKIVILRNPISFTSIEGIGIKQDIICYFGRFSKEKDIQFIIESFTLLRNMKKTNIKLYLIGSGDEEEKIKMLVKDNIYRTEISIFEFMNHEKLIEIIKPCKYSIMASRLYENAPMTILESVSLYIIPLVPDLGGMKETVESVVKIGGVYKQGDKESFVRCFEYLEAKYLDEIEKIAELNQRLTNDYGTGNYLKELNSIYKKVSGQYS